MIMWLINCVVCSLFSRSTLPVAVRAPVDCWRHCRKWRRVLSMCRLQRRGQQFCRIACQLSTHCSGSVCVWTHHHFLPIVYFTSTQTCLWKIYLRYCSPTPRIHCKAEWTAAHRRQPTKQKCLPSLHQPFGTVHILNGKSRKSKQFIVRLNKVIECDVVTSQDSQWHSGV